jgi:hypothetical protein
MSLKTLIPLLVFLLGLIGVIACAAAAAIGWSAGSRLSQVNQTAFERIDETLGTVRDRVLDAQRRVQESKVTTEDIQQRLKEFTRKKTSEKLETQLAIEKTTTTLSQGLQQADLWLQLSTTSIQSVQEAFELGNSLGAPVDPTSLEPLIGKLANLQSQLTQVSELVDGVRERATEIAGGEPQEDRIEQAVGLTLRALATLGQVDARLGESADRLFETQTKGQQLKSKTDAYILAARVGFILLIAWMAVGQFSLCRSGWKACRRISTVD